MPSLHRLQYLLVLASAFAFAVDPNCNPFSNYTPTTQSTCAGSTMEYVGNGTVLTLSASFMACNSGDDSRISVFFDKLTHVESLSLWTFSYSIMWTDPETNCVVDVAMTTSESTEIASFDLGNDQNGFSNRPLTNISSLALNQWYTREFSVDPQKYSTFQFGFTCTTRSKANITRQVAFIRDIRWKSEQRQITLYNSMISCTECPYVSIDGAMCLTIDNRPTWIYNGSITAPALEVGPPLTVFGDVTVDVLRIGTSLIIHGCLLSNNRVQIVAFPGRFITITQNPSCIWPESLIIVDIWKFEGMPTNNTPCAGDLRFDNQRATITAYPGVAFITAPQDAVVCNGPINIAGLLVLAIVLPTVGAIGIFLGIYFGVKKYRQRKAERITQ